MITLVENKDIAINSISKDIMKQIEAMESYGLKQSEFSCFPELVMTLGSFAELYSHEINRENLILVLSAEIEKNKEFAQMQAYYKAKGEPPPYTSLGGFKRARRMQSSQFKDYKKEWGNS